MLEQVLQALAASGPLALVLGVAVVKLWNKVDALTAKVETQADAYADKLSVIRREQRDREDAMRIHYESRFDNERAENKADLKALTEVLQGYTEEE